MPLLLFHILSNWSFANQCPFLVSARKGPKEADLRGAELIAPAIKAAPLKNLSAHTYDAAQHLNDVTALLYVLAYGGGCRSRRPADFLLQIPA